MNRQEMDLHNKQMDARSQKKYSSFMGKTYSKKEDFRLWLTIVIIGFLFFIGIPYIAMYDHILKVSTEPLKKGLAVFIPFIGYCFYLLMLYAKRKVLSQDYKYQLVFKGELFMAEVPQSLENQYAYILEVNENGMAKVALFNSESTKKEDVVIAENVDSYRLVSQYSLTSEGQEPGILANILTFIE